MATAADAAIAWQTAKVYYEGLPILFPPTKPSLHSPVA